MFVIINQYYLITFLLSCSTSMPLQDITMSQTLPLMNGK